MNRKRIYNIIQYALLAAGQEDDFFDRDLGPIHIIKYVYLADLAYAQYNNGESYTGIEWKFHNFGPWNNEVHCCIDPALAEINAEKRLIDSRYEENETFIRYSLANYDLFEQKGKSLPLVISARLQDDIHKYNKDTPSLLGYVYRTAPMISAAPGELLDFSLAVKKKKEKPVYELQWDRLTIKKKKKFRKAMKAIREKRASQQTQKKDGFIKSPVKPLYDDIYDEGLDWVESLGGDPIPKMEFDARFSSDIWKSQSRKGDFSE
ncbi:hypothetical protein [Desulfobacula toluolica]|uniref:Conserved uncharacterized protein n=1 Tax=Desulfobacula toluolica (strain DSM 7467 / Tol2) TaxID=651182 RepID=K0NAQ4_DESTT|nr:hypothetical protein [Desulfobacula toluolica]CCK81209.1 conserved uncharacterized protein [Desulfobacula toluolica Tol2]